MFSYVWNSIGSFFPFPALFWSILSLVSVSLVVIGTFRGGELLVIVELAFQFGEEGVW